MILKEKATRIVESLKMNVYMNKKTKERHYILKGLSKVDESNWETYFGEVTPRYAKKISFLKKSEIL